MKVKAKEDFYSPLAGVIREGQILEMPKGADWIKAGFVVKVGRPRKEKEDGAEL